MGYLPWNGTYKDVAEQQATRELSTSLIVSDPLLPSWLWRRTFDVSFEAQHHYPGDSPGHSVGKGSLVCVTASDGPWAIAVLKFNRTSPLFNSYTFYQRNVIFNSSSLLDHDFEPFIWIAKTLQRATFGLKRPKCTRWGLKKSTF